MRDRWVTFDCYGTLIDWNRGIGDALARLWPGADGARLLREYHAVEPIVQLGRSISYRDVLTRSLRVLAAIEDFPLHDGEASSLGDSLPSWPAFPDVPPALREVRERGVRIAILSNTDPDLLQSSMAQIDVPVDATFTAADAGSYKPAHGHWNAFFRGTDAERDRCVHVGASSFHDLVPAGELGLKAIWINRTRDRSAARRDAELPDLSDLPATVDRLLPP